jgi:hypothetical protein
VKRKNKPKAVKGMSSAVILSVLIHAGLFLLAGMLVVFTVVKKTEQKFEPPKAVERPKMKLKKPKVKLKKSSKPKSTTRIVTRNNRASMPDIQLPEMSGLGDGLGDGLGGGFDMMPDLEKLTVFGSGETIGNDFEGRLYDLKFTRSGHYAPISEEEWRHLFYTFIKDDWNLRIFSRFYRSPKKLYSTCFVLPSTISGSAPAAFGMDDSKASGGMWIVHYKGKLVSTEDITFRFCVWVDDSLAIRVDNELVIAASWRNPGSGDMARATAMYGNLWHSTAPESGKSPIPHRITVGDWITLKAGEPKDMEVVATDNPALGAIIIVVVQVKGVEYPKALHGGPLLPVFKTEELSHDQLDMIYRGLPDGLVDFVNGPIFRDY